MSSYCKEWIDVRYIPAHGILENEVFMLDWSCSIGPIVHVLDHIWSHFFSEDGSEMTESGDDWDDFIDHDVKTFVERGDVVNAYIRASGPLVR